MNQIATITEVTAADLARERRLNETILKGDITVDVAHYLKAFDEFYADDVVIAESASAVPVRGKEENRERLESFIIFAHVIFEVGDYKLDHFRLADSWVEDGVCYSDWELVYSAPAALEGERKAVAWRIARRWSAGRVVQEQQQLSRFPPAVDGRWRTKLVAAICALTLGWLILPAHGPAHGQIAVRNQGFVPYSEEPINYRSANLNDPVARLQKRIDRGEARLEYEPQHGYLKSVLEKLAIPISSQTLVFSKTSFQYKKISPQTPRALYFNDDVYVGWVRDGKVLEIASFDPMQGAIFYILDEQKVDEQKLDRQKLERPAFERAELDCTQCHVAASTRRVPGVMLRSIHANPSGTQATQAASFVTGHESLLKDRWGGWYVTGTHGRQTHMGNVVVQDREHPERLDRVAGANVADLSKRFDTSAYLTNHSDIVAHLVLAHQTQMHNLITLTNYQTRLALHAEAARNEATGRPASALSPSTLSETARKQYEGPAEELLRYLLFVDEAPLEDRITGSSAFAEEFAARGPRDPRGRSLRDFDLRTRMFKYPCSYLIYSEAFDALPSPAKEYLYRRLLEVLTGREQSPEFARLTGVDRQAILEILLATKPGLPEEWKKYGKQVHKGEKHPSRKRPGLSVK